MLMSGRAVKKLAAVTASSASRNDPASSSGTRNSRSLASEHLDGGQHAPPARRP